MSRRLFERAYASKKAALKAGDLSGGRMGPFWDRLVFSKIKARLGGARHVVGSSRNAIPAAAERLCGALLRHAAQATPCPAFCRGVGDLLISVASALLRG